MRSHAAAIALHDAASLRIIEREAASALPPGTLMTRAGEAAARWIVGRHPLARRIRIWCGPGNNGGDGYACALALRARLVAQLCERLVDRHAVPLGEHAHCCTDGARVGNAAALLPLASRRSDALPLGGDPDGQ